MRDKQFPVWDGTCSNLRQKENVHETNRKKVAWSQGQATDEITSKICIYKVHVKSHPNQLPDNLLLAIYTRHDEIYVALRPDYQRVVSLDFGSCDCGHYRTGSRSDRLSWDSAPLGHSLGSNRSVRRLRKEVYLQETSGTCEKICWGQWPEFGLARSTSFIQNQGRIHVTGSRETDQYTIPRF